MEELSHEEDGQFEPNALEGTLEGCVASMKQTRVSSEIYADPSCTARGRVVKSGGCKLNCVNGH